VPFRHVVRNTGATIFIGGCRVPVGHVFHTNEGLMRKSDEKEK